jgi:hypothetical protein
MAGHSSESVHIVEEMDTSSTSQRGFHFVPAYGGSINPESLNIYTQPENTGLYQIAF